MNDHQPYKKEWNAADFGRYYNGSMPAAEMHALEKAALADPFLEDALQGYAHTNTPVEDINEIKKRLQAGNKKAAVIWFKRRPVLMAGRVAAAVLLFAGVTWVLTNRNKTGQEEALATSGKPATIQQQFPALQPDSAKDIIAMLPQAGSKPYNSTVKAREQDAAPAPVPAASLAVAPSSTMAEAVQLEADRNDAAKAATAKILANAEQDKASLELAGKIATDYSSAGKPVTGRIVDGRGAPVANAMIRNKQNNQVMVADKDGNFALNAAGNMANIAVDVNALGYASNAAELDTAGNNIVVLQEMNESLSEVVVTSAYEQKRTARAAAKQQSDVPLIKNILVGNAVSVPNRAQLNQAATATISKLRSLQPSGQATIQFDVDAAGSPTNIVVKPNACASCLQELIGLVHALPALRKVKKNKKLTLQLSW